MKAKTRAKIKATTQEHLVVKNIQDDLVITKIGSVALTIETTAVNFNLLSEQEQDNKIYAFAGLLNSLNFDIQILIRTKRIDISNYIDKLKKQSHKDMTPELRKQIQIYTRFVQNLIVQNDVLDKKFYITISYDGESVDTTGISLTKRKKKDDKESVSTQQLIEKSKIFLYPKRDHLLRQLGRMGLVGHQLTSEELIEIFYDIYNPEENE